MRSFALLAFYRYPVGSAFVQERYNEEQTDLTDLDIRRMLRAWWRERAGPANLFRPQSADCKASIDDALSGTKSSFSPWRLGKAQIGNTTAVFPIWRETFSVSDRFCFY